MADKKIKYVNIKDSDYRPKPKKKMTRDERDADKYYHAHKTTMLQRVGGLLNFIGTTVLSVILIVIITLCIVAAALTVYIMQFAESSFDVDLTDVELSYSSFIYAKNSSGEDVMLKQIAGETSRIWVDIDDIPQHTIDCFVSVEDQRFFEHNGVDWKRTLGVTVQALFSGGTDGGSTITQQLVRDITQDKETTIGRKLREIFRALSLENKYTKFDILESYLNRISFGGTAYGIGSAAYYYFGKEVKDLTIAESAILAGLVRSPSNYNPYANLKQSKIRQEYALKDCLYAQGYITTDEFEAAMKEKVKFRRPVKGTYYGYTDMRYNDYYGIITEDDKDDGDLYYQNVPWEDVLGEDSSLAYQWNGSYEVSQNWYVDAAIDQIVSDLAGKLAISYNEAWDEFRRGGYTAYLNMDMKMQDKLSKIFEDPSVFLSAYDATLPADSKNLIQGAFVIMDYRGDVLAIAGGFGEKPGDNCFNRATQAVSAIGSTIKPIANYSYAIDRNLITYSTMLQDISGRIPASYAGDSKFSAESGYDEATDTVRWPHNYQETGFGSGNMYPAWYAVQKSLNTIAARVMQKIGLSNAYNHLVNDLGFGHLDSADIAFAPLATGALTKGATLTELTAAYQIMGNGGMYYKPYYYSKVIDSKGEVVLEQDTVGKRAIGEDSAWITNRMMLKVVQDDYGTGHYAKLGNCEVVGKTGTANDMSNLLFAGLTPEYVACYRIAYDDNHEIGKKDGWRTIALAWHDVMVNFVDTEKELSFTPDSSTLELPYCTETGLLATSRCPSRTIGYYRPSNIPPSCDSFHNGTYWATHWDSEIPLYE